MIQLEQINKFYGKFQALQDITLQFDTGIHAILSPNGAGKTTLLQLLTTNLRPTSGKILCDGEDIQVLQEKYRERLRYLPQNFGYYPNWSPLDYISYLVTLRGLRAKDYRQQILDKLEEFGLGDVAKKPMKTFSGGMLRRVGIVQTLIGDADIFIYDEPTAGLDPLECARFKDLIGSFPKDRIVILSTHIISDVDFLAEKVLMLRDKQVLLHEDTQTLCGKLEGRVLEATVTEEQLHILQQHGKILEKKAEHNGLYVRFLANEEATSREGLPAMQAVTPTLEDVFGSYYQKEPTV